jgi:hypothetical protein
MSRHDPLSPAEAEAIEALRARFPQAWRTITLRVWDGQRPAGTATLLTRERLAVLARMKRSRGVTWLGSARI